MFNNPADIKIYALAGHATITIKSQRTGSHFTYKISRLNEDGAPKDLWFVGLLSGPDNESDYRYLGVINGEFKTTAKSPQGNPTSVRAFRYFWHHVAADRMPPEVEVRHCNFCGRCGRKLTTPESVDTGLGPICRAEMGL